MLSWDRWFYHTYLEPVDINSPVLDYYFKRVTIDRYTKDKMETIV